MGHFPNKSRFAKENDPYTYVGAFLPKGTAEILRSKSAETGLPMSKLISIAIDNELDSPAPFNYPCLLPSSIFIPGAFVEECARIVQYLMRFPSGCGREQLMLSRRDFGVPNRDTLMYAYRELLEMGIIKEVAPPPRTKFKYPEGYKYTRLANTQKVKALK